MTVDIFPDHKLLGALEMSIAIDHVITTRKAKAYESQYDVMVCVRSVDAARKVFEGIPIKGTARAYGKVVETALDKLADDYYDSAGDIPQRE